MSFPIARYRRLARSDRSIPHAGERLSRRRIKRPDPVGRCRHEPSRRRYRPPFRVRLCPPSPRRYQPSFRPRLPARLSVARRFRREILSTAFPTQDWTHRSMSPPEGWFLAPRTGRPRAARRSVRQQSPYLLRYARRSPPSQCGSCHRCRSRGRVRNKHMYCPDNTLRHRGR